VTLPSTQLHLLSLERVWGKASHNSMPDMIHFNDRWLIAFREGERHAGDYGAIRIIESKDSICWQEAAYFYREGFDFRDPQFSLTPDGRLELLFEAVINTPKGEYVSRRPYVSFSHDAREWTKYKPILEPEEWLWKITWHNAKAYGVSYRYLDEQNPKGDWQVKLFESDDGEDFNCIVRWDIPGQPCECVLRFLPDQTMVALLRRNRLKPAMIGTSRPPYVDWNWCETSRYFAGPDFIVLPDGRMLAAGRFIHPNPYGLMEKTVIADMSTNDLRKSFYLPSAGDNSYPSLCYRENTLWVCYYSSHEMNTSIYLARLELLN